MISGQTIGKLLPVASKFNGTRNFAAPKCLLSQENRTTSFFARDMMIEPTVYNS